MAAFSQKKEEKKIIYRQLEIKRDRLDTYFQKSMADSIAEMFSPNCRMAMEYDTLVEDREGVSAYLKNDFLKGKEILQFRCIPEEKKIYDEIIIEMGVCLVEYTRPIEKKLYKKKMNYLFVWKKADDNVYRIRAAMWNSSSFPCK